MSLRRVVVTGMGMVSPLGNDVFSNWEGITSGKSGIEPIEHFDASAFSVKFGGFVKNFDVSQYMSVKEARKIDGFIQYGMAAGQEAMIDSGLEVTEGNAHRFGVAVGSGIGGIGTIEKNKEALDKSGPRRVSPFLVPGSIISMVPGNLSIKYGLKGPNIAISTACTSATHCIGFGMQQVQLGTADMMMVGGAEMGSSSLGMAGFAAARALSTRNDDPQAASRPWDKDRDGFVLGDGAGILILEELEHAKARGAKIYAELIGFGMSGDAYHMTSPPDDGSGAAAAMVNALAYAKINSNQVQYINAHGTSTPAGDKAETQAIRSVFGSSADGLAVSSTKSMVGHLLGAAGGVEAIYTIKSITEQVAPPTINLDNPGEGCDLDYVPGTARQMDIETAVSNSFGFGGTNGTVIFRKI